MPSKSSRRIARAALATGQLSIGDNDEDGLDDALALADLRAAHESSLADGERSGCRVTLCGRLTSRHKWNSVLVLDFLAGGTESVHVVVEEDENDAAAVTRIRMLTLGSLVRITDGDAGKTGRGQFCLFVAPRAVELLQNFGGEQYTDPSLQRPARFHLVPSTVRWQRALDKLGVGAYNSLAWRGGSPIPVPPSASCWLLPASDVAALAIATQQHELRAAGWKLLTCDAAVVSRLSHKGLLRQHAARLGLLEHLPRHYESAEVAKCPSDPL